MNWPARTLLCVALALGASGCNLPKMAVDAMAPVFAQTKDDFMGGKIVKHAREAGPGLIALVNGLVLASPENPELRLLQAELNTSFAFGFLEQEDPVWASDMYRRGQAAALAALADEDDDLAASLAKMPLPALDAALQEQDEDALPALFWWAFARGAEININRSDTKLVKDLPRVDAVMTWVLSINERFYFAGPHLFFAMRYTSLPATLGGEPEKGLVHFEKVDQLTGKKMLMAQVMRAQFYAPNLAATKAGATKAQILAAQKATWTAYFGGLQAVLDAPDDLWPEQNLVNAIAKQRAKALLKNPEAHNVIPPPGVKNPHAPSDEGAWGDDDDG